MADIIMLASRRGRMSEEVRYDPFAAIRCAMIDLPSHRMEELRKSKEPLIALCEKRARAIFGTVTDDMITQIQEEFSSSENVALFWVFHDLLSDIDPWKRTMRGSINGSLAAYLLGITEVNPIADETAIPNVFFAGPRFAKGILWKIGVSAQTEAELIRRLKKDGIDVHFPVELDEPITSDTQYQVFFARSRRCELLEHLQTLTGVDPADIPVGDMRRMHLTSSDVFEEDLYKTIAEKTVSPDTAYRIVKRLKSGKHLINEQLAECEKAGVSDVIRKVQNGTLTLWSKSDFLATAMQRSRLDHYAEHWPDQYKTACFIKEEERHERG